MKGEILSRWTPKKVRSNGKVLEHGRTLPQGTEGRVVMKTKRKPRIDRIGKTPF